MLQGDSLPPSMAAFCPADHSLVVYTGYGVDKELSFYSLTKKQVSQIIFVLLHMISDLYKTIVAGRMCKKSV